MFRSHTIPEARDAFRRSPPRQHPLFLCVSSQFLLYSTQYLCCSNVYSVTSLLIFNNLMVVVRVPLVANYFKRWIIESCRERLVFHGSDLGTLDFLPPQIVV